MGQIGLLGGGEECREHLVFWSREQREYTEGSVVRVGLEWGSLVSHRWWGFTWGPIQRFGSGRLGDNLEVH